MPHAPRHARRPLAPLLVSALAVGLGGVLAPSLPWALACDADVSFRGGTIGQWRQTIRRLVSREGNWTDDVLGAASAVQAFGPRLSDLAPVLRQAVQGEDFLLQMFAADALLHVGDRSAEALSAATAALEIAERGEGMAGPEIQSLLAAMATHGTPGAVETILASVRNETSGSEFVRLLRRGRLGILAALGVRIARDPLGVLAEIAGERAPDWVWELVGVMENVTDETLRAAVVARARRRLAESEDGELRLPLMLVVSHSGLLSRVETAECRARLEALPASERWRRVERLVAVEAGWQVMLPWFRRTLADRSEDPSRLRWPMHGRVEPVRALLPDLVRRAQADGGSAFALAALIHASGLAAEAVGSGASPRAGDGTAPNLAWRVLVASVDRGGLPGVEAELTSLARDPDGHNRYPAAVMLKWLPADVPWVGTALRALACEDPDSLVRETAR